MARKIRRRNFVRRQRKRVEYRLFRKSESLFQRIKRGQAASQPSESPSPYIVFRFPDTFILFEDIGYGFGRIGIAVSVPSDGQLKQRESGEIQAVCRDDIWKYCTREQWKEMICSFGLLGDPSVPEEVQMAVLYRFSRNSSRCYREAEIPKRSGGVRRLMIPDSGLKAVQRRILRNILLERPVSPCAFAYRKGVGIRDNAAVHIGQERILKLDIQDFFDSITSSAVYGLAFPGTLFPPPVRGLLTALCCYKGRLPQGSPASPAISNLVMKPFDDSMDLWCRQRGIRYSRYCDDMTFSGSFEPGEVIRKTQSYLSELGMKLNWEKTGVYAENCRQEVTGITVNQKVQLSKDYRRKLRQDCYYCRKYGVAGHMERQGFDGRETEEHFLARLLGKIDYLLCIDPSNEEFKAQRDYFRQMMKNMKQKEE